MLEAFKGARRRVALLAMPALGVGVLAGPGAIAATAAPAGSQTIFGSLEQGTSPDTTGIGVVSVDATLSEGVASGTLSTASRTGGVGNLSRDEFTGSVTCMSVSGPRVAVAAHGSVTDYEESPPTSGEFTVKPLAGHYAQVVVFETAQQLQYRPGYATSRHRYAFAVGRGRLGARGHPPIKSCTPYLSDQPRERATRDGVRLSPSIVEPQTGAAVGGEAVRFAGLGEPDTLIRLTQTVPDVSELDFATAAVDENGEWSVTLYGVAQLGAPYVEFVASAVEGSTVPSNPVRFTLTE